MLCRSASEFGFVASADDPHYTSLWTRDAAFSAMGAHVSGDPALIAAARHSLLTLAKIQAPNGQIPDAYWPHRDYWDWGEAGATDASALFIVAAGEHLRLHPDVDLCSQLWPCLERAFSWLASQDANQFGLIDSPEAGDWMDSTLCRSGKVLYVNVLYYQAAIVMTELAPTFDVESNFQALASNIRDKINHLFWPESGASYAEILSHHRAENFRADEFPHPASPAAYAAAARRGRWHYLSHVQWGRFVDECDTLGNILAVRYGVADSGRAKRIMRHLHLSPAVQPYPVCTYTRSFAAGDRWGMYKAVADPFQGERWRNPPGSYHNGAVWPFIGGLYVDALNHVGMRDEARAELVRLAAANRLSDDGGEWGFHEWIHADTGLPSGARHQTWSAGTFVLAHHSTKGF